MENQNITNTLSILVDKFDENLYRRYNSLTDYFLIRENEALINQFSNIKRLLNKDPRFPWQIIQNNIDELYKRDNSLLGVRIEILFEDLKTDKNQFNPKMYGIPRN
ncbi:hypothetical protein [Tenacibaculum dicentrarchi]|uniref:Uncharacterized protein n=1 Tax=Tenacibaculum dicentrarchi TaxID=669041 RepID=A0ABM9P068_9FLAO|nr:hypothetical protein TD3509T_60231 [Tenacibaculum dicentrarchi]